MSLLIPPPDFSKIKQVVRKTRRLEPIGRILDVVGLVAEANGPSARIGDACIIESAGNGQIVCEVVGFRNQRILLMPLGEMQGLRAGCSVRTTGNCLSVPVGPALLGRVLNALGEPMDQLPPPRAEVLYPIHAEPPNALERKMIAKEFRTGVRAIDGSLTVGVGQRVGIFAGSGVGKSTLLGMIARNGEADVNVIALIGERGREVREFIENDLGEEGLKKSVVVCATSDQPALLRIKAAMAATSIAEYFRDQGKSVMFTMDSVTRFAMAQREVGLAIGEPPSTKGYTPSVFALLPRLMERAGNSAKGSITALYTVLVEGDDTSEPIADAARAILDGHIVLNRKLTERGHYPPIDVSMSLSRTMPMVVDNDHLDAARKLRELIAAYNDSDDLISIGAYQKGTKPIVDLAVERWEHITKFLRQQKDEFSTLDATVTQLKEIVNA